MPVVLSGVKSILDSLDKVNPLAARQVENEVKNASTPIVNKARGFAPTTAPLSGWGKAVGKWANRVYDPFEVRSGIGFSDEPTKKNRKGFSYTAYIFNKSAAGAIYETAGRLHPNGRKQAPSVQHYANAGTPQARPDYMMRSSDKRYSQSANPNAGKQFISALGAIYKVPRVKGQAGRSNRKKNGRLIFRAWGEDQGRVLGAIGKAYSKVVADFNAGKLK